MCGKKKLKNYWPINENNVVAYLQYFFANLRSFENWEGQNHTNGFLKIVYHTLAGCIILIH